MGAVRIHSANKLTLLPSPGVKPGLLRKLTEYITAGSDIRVNLVQESSGAGTAKASKPVRKEEGMVTIKSTGGRSYADLVKDVKDQVDIAKLGLTINRIQKTEKGDLALTVAGGQDKVRALQQEITSKVTKCEVQAKVVGMSALMVLGIDPTIGRDTIKGVIGKDIGLDSAGVVVRSLKQGKDGTNNATIEVPKECAMQLARKLQIQIGWTICSIKEIVKLSAATSVSISATGLRTAPLRWIVGKSA